MKTQQPRKHDENQHKKTKNLENRALAYEPESENSVKGGQDVPKAETASIDPKP